MPLPILVPMKTSFPSAKALKLFTWLTVSASDTVTLLTYIEIFKYKLSKIYVCLMVFKATFNKILVISWRSVLFVEETGGPRENHRPVAS
jgi:hypothetical protein